METLLLFGGALIVVCGVLGFVFQNEIRNYLWPEESTEIKCISQQRARLSHDFTPEHGWQRMPDSPLRPNEVCFERPLAQGGTSLSAPTPSSAPADRATPSAKEAPAKEAPPALPEPSGEDDDAPMFPEE